MAYSDLTTANNSVAPANLEIEFLKQQNELLEKTSTNKLLQKQIELQECRHENKLLKKENQLQKSRHENELTKVKVYWKNIYDEKFSNKINELKNKTEKVNYLEIEKEYLRSKHINELKEKEEEVTKKFIDNQSNVTLALEAGNVEELYDQINKENDFLRAENERLNKEFKSELQKKENELQVSKIEKELLKKENELQKSEFKIIILQKENEFKDSNFKSEFKIKNLLNQVKNRDNERDYEIELTEKKHKLENANKEKQLLELKYKNELLELKYELLQKEIEKQKEVIQKLEKGAQKALVIEESEDIIEVITNFDEQTEGYPVSGDIADTSFINLKALV